MPYITASIIIQLMTSVYPVLKKYQEEGELGRRKITQLTRYLTVVLCLVQGMGIAFWLQRQPGLVMGGGGWTFTLMATLTMTAGTIFIMWIGEQITERGIGNGISLLIFAGIVVGVPNAITQLYERVKDPGSALFVLVLLVVMVIITAGIVFFERGTAQGSDQPHEAHGRSPGGRDPIVVLAAEGQYRGRHSGHFRVISARRSRKRSRPSVSGTG